MKNRQTIKTYNKRPDNDSYSTRYKLDAQEIESDIRSKNDIAGVMVLAMCEAGYDHGKKALFSKDGPEDFLDFQSDPAWQMGPGVLIDRIQRFDPKVDVEVILDYYEEAYFRGLVDSGQARDEMAA